MTLTHWLDTTSSRLVHSHEVPTHCWLLWPWHSVSPKDLRSRANPEMTDRIRTVFLCLGNKCHGKLNKGRLKYGYKFVVLPTMLPSSLVDRLVLYRVLGRGIEETYKRLTSAKYLCSTRFGYRLRDNPPGEMFAVNFNKWEPFGLSACDLCVSFSSCSCKQWDYMCAMCHDVPSRKTKVPQLLSWEEWTWNDFHG